MSGPRASDTFEIVCPTCGAKVVVKEKDAERTMVARCPNGHEIPLAKALS